MTTRLWLCLAAALALSAPVAAQPVGSPQQITVVDSGTACVTAPTACATFTLDSSTGSLSLSVSGTWTGTLTFEGTNANGVWTSVVAVNLATGAQATTTTANGLFSVTNAGIIAVRARATAAITGTAVITAARGIGFTRLFGPSPTFTQVLLGDGSAGAPSLTFASAPTLGFYKNSATYLGLGASGANQYLFGPGDFRINSDTAVISLGLNTDVNLFRDGAANTLGLRNSTNAQTFRVYNTYTDAANSESASAGWSGNIFSVLVNAAGTGSSRNMVIGTGSSSGSVALQTSGTTRWTVNGATGALSANSAYNFSTSGSILALGPTLGVGYGTGAGGAITQLTSRTTGVTLNTVSGDITLFSAAGSATAASFTVTNSAVAAVDNIVINQKSGTNLYNVIVTTVGAGSFVVTFYTTGGTAVDAPVFHFSVVKGANS